MFRLRREKLLTHLEYSDEAVFDGHAGDFFDVGRGLLDAVGKATFEELEPLGRAARVEAVPERLEGRPVLVHELLVERGLLHYVPAHALALLQSFERHQLLVQRALLMYIAPLGRYLRFVDFLITIMNVVDVIFKFLFHLSSSLYYEIGIDIYSLYFSFIEIYC